MVESIEAKSNADVCTFNIKGYQGEVTHINLRTDICIPGLGTGHVIWKGVIISYQFWSIFVAQKLIIYLGRSFNQIPWEKSRGKPRVFEGQAYSWNWMWCINLISLNFIDRNMWICMFSIWSRKSLHNWLKRSNWQNYSKKYGDKLRNNC